MLRMINGVPVFDCDFLTNLLPGLPLDFKNPNETAEVAGAIGFRFGAGVGIVLK